MKYEHILFSIIFLAVIASMSFISYSLVTGDFTIQRPSNGTTNSSTNDTQPFVFKYANATISNVNCSLYFDSVPVANNGTVINNTNTTFYSNASLGADGYHSWYVYCYNATATPTNMTSATTDLIIDTTAPTYIYPDQPSASYNTSNSTVLFRVSGIDNIGDYYNYKMANFTLWVNGQNKSAFQYANNTKVTFTEVFPDGLYYWNITIRDNASNSLRSGTDTFRVDTTAPAFSAYTVDNVTKGNDYIARINYTTTDAQLPIGNVFVYLYYTNSTNTSSVSTNVKSGAVYGTLTQNTTGLTIMNQIDLAGTDIISDGAFTIEPNSNDTLGNVGAGTNQTNWTKATLYTGWNMIAIDRNTTLSNISNFSSNIDKVSFWNNSGGSWINYVKGANTNEGQKVADGEAAYVHTLGTTYLLRKWSIDSQNKKNASYIAGWNQVGTWNTTLQLYQACQLSLDNASASIMAVSYYDASVSQYYSQVCSLKTGWNNNYTLVRGKTSLWFNINTTSSMAITR